MAERQQWTEDLGQAFVAQPREVMDTIQQLRARADAAGTLQSNDEVLVERQGYDYVIEPAVPGFLYGVPIGPAFWFGASTGRIATCTTARAPGITTAATIATASAGATTATAIGPETTTGAPATANAIAARATT
jgi:hypothetical protein